MTTATAPRTNLDGIRLSFGGVLRSEWIKLRTLRSTMWCYGLIVLLAAASGLLAFTFRASPGAAAMSADGQHQMQLGIATLGVNFTQLIVAVLAVLVIGGEYGTGMIRSTFVAVPGRLGAFFGKLVVLAVTTFVIGLVSIAAAAAVAWPILTRFDVTANPFDGSVLLPILGGAGYLTLVAVLAFGIGSIVRNSAGGIATALGLLLVAPAILNILSGMTQQTWVRNVSAFLPSSAGGQMFAFQQTGQAAQAAADQAAAAGIVQLDAWSGLAVLAAWALVAVVIGAVLTKRRDA